VGFFEVDGGGRTVAPPIAGVTAIGRNYQLVFIQLNFIQFKIFIQFYILDSTTLACSTTCPICYFCHVKKPQAEKNLSTNAAFL